MPRFRWLFTFALLLATLPTAWAQQSVSRDAFRSLPPGVRALRDIPYVSGGNKSQTLDLYFPSDAPASHKLPLVIWVHGGSWSSGDKSTPFGAFLIPQGYALASLNYRLSGEAKFPAQIQDCKAAIRFLRAKATDYQLDPDRFGVWGGSAGGHLVALLGTTNDTHTFDVGEHLDVSSKVQAVCDWYGPTDLYQLAKQVQTQTPDKYDPARNPLASLFGFTITDAMKDKMAPANPITYISPAAAPFLIMHGNADPTVPIEQSAMLADALKKAGANVTFHTLNAPHGSGDFAKPAANQEVLKFFNQHLKPQTKPGERGV